MPDASGSTSGRAPALFVGHGSPINAIEDNVWSRAFRALGAALPRPRAVLCVSAHWCARGSFLTSNERPRTIHDFAGFPAPLYAVEYPAPGDPALARRAAALLGGGARTTDEWGLDHGAWSVLLHLFPRADVPVVQLSVDLSLRPAEIVAAGRALAPLRDEGVMVLGSGNVTHNLRHAFDSLRRGETAPPEWASSFDAAAARAVEARDLDFLEGALAGEAGRTAHPTPDHYLPLLYVVGAAADGERPTWPIVGFDMSSLSMRAALFG